MIRYTKCPIFGPTFVDMVVEIKLLPHFNLVCLINEDSNAECFVSVDPCLIL